MPREADCWMQTKNPQQRTVTEAYNIGGGHGIKIATDYTTPSLLLLKKH
jgi:hypothetical protein